MANLIYNVLPRTPRKIVAARPDCTLKKCIELMEKFDIGAVVIKNDEEQVVGIVSERDVIRSCFLSQSINPFTAKVRDIMFTKSPVLSSHDTVEKALHVMHASKRRHLLIQDKDQADAILSITDLMDYLLDNNAKVIEQLEHYIY